MFLTSVIIRIYGTPEQFQTWSYISTYLTLFFSFSVLGAEQLIIRFSTYENGKGITLTYATIQLFMIGSAIFLGLFLFVMNGRLFAYTIAPVNAVVLLVAISVLQASYQKNRLLGANTLGQFTFNLWRVVLFTILSGMLLMQEAFDLERIVTLVLAGCAVIAYLLSGHRIPVHIEKHYKGEVGIFLALAISLCCMSALGLLDRFMIEKAAAYEGLNFEDYFYLITLVVFPFNILASYIGYVMARIFKAEMRKDVFLRLSMKVIFGSIGLSILWCGLLSLGADWLSLPSINMTSWVILIVLIVLRCGYAVLSAAVSVRAPYHCILLSNLISLSGLMIVAYLGIAFATILEHIIGLYALAWLARYASLCLGLKESYT